MNTIEHPNRTVTNTSMNTLRTVTNTMTPKQFREAHNLSVSSFQRLITKVSKIHPELVPFSEKVVGKQWVVHHVQVLEAHLNTIDDGNRTPIANMNTEHYANMNTEHHQTPSLDDSIGMLALKLAKSTSPVQEVVEAELVELPSASQLATRQSDLTASVTQSLNLSTVIDSSIAQLLNQNRLQQSQERERQQLQRANELKAIALDEVIRIQEELQVRHNVRSQLDSTAEVQKNTVQQLHRVSEALS